MNIDGEMRILVAQLGARRHYAVPLAFQQHGLLSRFCTDIYIGSNRVGGLISAAAKLSGSRGFQRLKGRTEHALPAARVKSFPWFGLQYKWRVRRATTTEGRTAAWLWGGRRFCRLVAREMHGQYDAVFAYTSAAKELFHRARKTGAVTYLDHATAPRRYETSLVSEEAERFPGWALRGDEDRLIDDYHQRQREELSLADVILCGSTYVKSAVEAEGVESRKIHVVPLGIGGHTIASYPRPSEKAGKLRVLFVGGDGLRKGIGYLAQAIDLLGASCIETRVAGDLEISKRGLTELRRNLTLLGPVPRTEMEALFRWADVLVLPSISDTFGLVILEAMARGLPVITTPNTCGPDVIRESVDGYIVPIRDPHAIADRLERLAAERALLRSMSECVIDRAAEFTIERYGERLVDAAYSVFLENGLTLAGDR